MAGAGDDFDLRARLGGEARGQRLEVFDRAELVALAVDEQEETLRLIEGQ